MPQCPRPARAGDDRSAATGRDNHQWHDDSDPSWAVTFLSHGTPGCKPLNIISESNSDPHQHFVQVDRIPWPGTVDSELKLSESFSVTPF